MPKNDGKLGGGFLRQTVLGSGVSLMLVIGKGESNRGREMLTCIDITTMTKMDVIVTTAAPNSQPSLGKIGAVTKYKKQILQYMTGETHDWGAKQRKTFEKTVAPHLTYAIVAFRGYDQVPYVIGFMKLDPINNLESGTSKDKDSADGADGPENLNKPRLCTGLDNFMWKGTGDYLHTVTDTAGDGTGLALAGISLRDNGRVAIVGTHNAWMHLANPVSNRWAAHKIKNKAGHSSHVFTLRSKSLLNKSPGVVNWDKNDTWDLSKAKIHQSGYYRFSAGYDCATWERPLYGRRTVAYLGRLASQLRRLAGLVSAGFGVMLENFHRINKIKIYNPNSVLQIPESKTWLPVLLKDIPGGGGLGTPLQDALPEWLFKNHEPMELKNGKPVKADRMPKFADNATFYLPEEACDPTRIVPPLEQALCCEYIRMTDFGGINRFIDKDPADGGATDIKLGDYLNNIHSAGNFLAWRLQKATLDVGNPATSIQAGSTSSEGELLSANITGTPIFQEGGPGAGTLKVHKPGDLYTAGKTSYEQGCRLESAGPSYTAREVKVPDYKKETGRLEGSLSYLHYHNVEGHHGDPFSRHQSEKRAGDWRGGVWNFARGYFRPLSLKLKQN
jgi:hypothetical protein